ncbi:2-amino-4-hydroxy-6-hydroxymethyldihydropteridine diphosphokinase [Mangrovimonas aestuarii]|uniref:2-amino-4-hydroxy-6- hydroxymethyldihydropteridine diphosphokinase n=1 Tax=Mangrovimonas aestuarii TaxID=3018443 RepID=UPI002379ABAD|nr:2-amino-4-hydroxy-6-hydroxymethyldihydropteridine diphosphokinase [Mangrovimonas aestuarii]
MREYKLVYISLGSNIGERLNYLQNAVNTIFDRIGAVRAISKVYSTPALGFEGDDFLNACVLVETSIAPEDVMTELLNIEKELGRVRSEGSGYQSRTVDLDMVFYEDEIHNTEHLVLPHPQMQHRKFVLQPLKDIAAECIHPVLKKSVTELLRSCDDDSVLVETDFSLINPQEQFGFSKYNYIAIEGNIGAGKTSLATQLANDFNAKLILERFADNPFLPKFYSDIERYAFPLEMSFLADRYQQISDDLSQLDLFKDFVISDYDVFKSLIFSKITLPEEEFKLYRKLFYLMYKDIPKPDLYIYLHQETEQLQHNIKKRGRGYEQNISHSYLDKITSGYLEFLRNNTKMNVKIINLSNRDFVKDRQVYMGVLKEISAE